MAENKIYFFDKPVDFKTREEFEQAIKSKVHVEKSSGSEFSVDLNRFKKEFKSGLFVVVDDYEKGLMKIDYSKGGDAPASEIKSEIPSRKKQKDEADLKGDTEEHLEDGKKVFKKIEKNLKHDKKIEMILEHNAGYNLRLTKKLVEHLTELHNHAKNLTFKNYKSELHFLVKKFENLARRSKYARLDRKEYRILKKINRDLKSDRDALKKYIGNDVPVPKHGINESVESSARYTHLLHKIHVESKKFYDSVGHFDAEIKHMEEFVKLIHIEHNHLQNKMNQFNNLKSLIENIGDDEHKFKDFIARLKSALENTYESLRKLLEHQKLFYERTLTVEHNVKSLIMEVDKFGEILGLAEDSSKKNKKK